MMTSTDQELRCVISDLCDQVRERDKEIARLRAENEALRVETGRLLRWAEMMSDSWLMGGKIRYSGDHPLATARALLGEPPHPWDAVDLDG